MNAIIVSVDYSDILAITLPYNRCHFDQVLIVTSTSKVDCQSVGALAVNYGCFVYATDEFYRGGADFNKWLALESGLDRLGRKGWLCLLDADVLWPKTATVERYLHKGLLLGPLRRMYPYVPASIDEVPSEDLWSQYPVHRNVNEWAGYTQIFHAEDPHLGSPPWHETNWRHAGGADSFFQAKWPRDCKARLPWHVLHLGEAGVNWCGRATPYSDGSLPETSVDRAGKVGEYIRGRRAKVGLEKYKHERLPE